ncbi:threonine/homoserine/homoserine lactone efflux protein [Robbsia andropogonis]|uniref:LysE family translocator n=1 Tax=Robbsia andropogonis TaxID=28092 RepID=UPI002A6A94F0|nr:LysE family transporter [Robbsia andropogonis]
MLLIKSMALGLCIAAPVGPIGMLCIQRCLSSGFRYGFATGIGAASADAIYGLFGALGVAGIANAQPALTIGLKICGGAFLFWLAWTTARETPVTHNGYQATTGANVSRYFLATFFLTLSNPITILSFIAMFAALASTAGFHGDREWSTVMTMVSGVFVGSAVWWLFLTILTSTLRRAMPSSWIRRLSLMSAIGIAAFGAFEMVTGTSSFIEVF